MFHDESVGTPGEWAKILELQNINLMWGPPSPQKDILKQPPAITFHVLLREQIKKGKLRPFILMEVNIW